MPPSPVSSSDAVSPSIPSSRFALFIGVLLLVEGIWGVFSDVVFGLLTTNRVHAVIHILLGVTGILTARKGGSHGFSVLLGVLLLVVGVLSFVPVAGEWMVRLLNVNVAVAVVNIFIGLVALVIASRDRAARPTW